MFQKTLPIGKRDKPAQWVNLSFYQIQIIFSLLLLSLFILSGCASSEVSRQAAANMDMGTRNARGFVGDGDSELADAYQNSKQATKGAIIGGTAGAVTGALSSGIGVIPGTATGMILGASYGSYIDANTTLQDQLENRGATIVVLGDQILIIIPSARLFHADTANIKSQAWSTLSLVARYINSYTTMLVKVAAYTNASGSSRVDLALSQQQAQSVAKVLLAQGINARVLYAMGYGGTRLVEKNCRDWDESENYRVEITLEKFYV